MTADIIDLPCITKLDIAPEKVLQGAIAEEMREVVVIGYGNDGRFYLAASKTNGGDIMWCLELAKAVLLRDRLQEIP